MEQDYILLIMNCKKYHTKSLFQKNTWLKMLPNNILYYHQIEVHKMTFLILVLMRL
jgi:hypothetical protein